MTRRMKAGAVLAACCVLAAGAAFGAGLLRSNWTLTIVVNVPGAQITVDNRLITGTSVSVAQAMHSVKVHADGYFDYSQNVNVTANMTLRVDLNPIVFPLTVRVNVAAATVYVDGVDVTGQAAAVTVGQHTVQVVARGYKDYNSVVDVSSALAVDVVLQPAGILLSVDANVADATVIVNNFAKGAVPYSEYLPPGAYTIRVSADGYADYIASVSLERPVTVSAKLKPQPRQTTPSTLTLVIAPDFSNPDVRPNDPAGQIKIFVDNKLVNGNRALDGIQVAPGRHTIRVSSGGLSIDVGDITVQPGMKYVIELTLDAQVRAVRAGQ